LVLAVECDVAVRSHADYLGRDHIIFKLRPISAEQGPRSTGERLSFPTPEGRGMPAISLSQPTMATCSKCQPAGQTCVGERTYAQCAAQMAWQGPAAEFRAAWVASTLSAGRVEATSASRTGGRSVVIMCEGLANRNMSPVTRPAFMAISRR